jgi:hypothetical protein
MIFKTPATHGKGKSRCGENYVKQTKNSLDRGPQSWDVIFLFLIGALEACVKKKKNPLNDHWAVQLIIWTLETNYKKKDLFNVATSVNYGVASFFELVWIYK